MVENKVSWGGDPSDLINAVKRIVAAYNTLTTRQDKYVAVMGKTNKVGDEFVTTVGRVTMALKDGATVTAQYNKELEKYEATYASASVSQQKRLAAEKRRTSEMEKQIELQK
jgi:hypothetical protein